MLVQLGAFIIILIVGHFAVGVAKDLRHRDSLDQRYRASVYDGWRERVEYWREFDTNWAVDFAPYYHWRRFKSAGKFINVDENGERITPKLSAPSPEAMKVFVLGGSTTWGTGAIDSETIPAFLQRKFGPDYDVSNLGETAYVSTQEVAYLMALLSQGRIPDIVVFYDGVNDGYSGVYSPAIPRDPHSIRADFAEAQQRKQWSGLRHLYEKSNYPLLVSKLQQWLGLTPPDENWDSKIIPNIEENAKATLDVWEANIRQVRALGREYGFRSFFFWQPHQLSGTRDPVGEWEAHKLDVVSPGLLESQRVLFEMAERRLAGREDEGIYFLGHAFDDVREPLYIDWHHVSAKGNEIIAQKMAEALKSQESSFIQRQSPAVDGAR